MSLNAFATFLVFLSFLRVEVHARSESGLRGQRNVDAATFKAEIRSAMDEALGCGGEISEEHLKDVEGVLQPMFRTLPKNAAGHLERRSLRYLAYRYFHRKSALVVRGFEPTRPVNDSSWGAAAILSEQVPAYVESVLESAHAKESGFTLRDAAMMVSTLEQLIFDSETTVLEKIYDLQHKPLQRPLSEQGLQQLMEAYLAVWMAGDDIVPVLGKNRELSQVFPHWDQLIKFAHGQISALKYQRQKQPKLASSLHPGGNALSARYSFDDAHAIVGGITRSFASFWESECREMKRKLSTLDLKHTGRVPLSKFYGKSLTDSEWRFGESESYLRELGALDETSWLGKQVIIPNYIQGTSNCIVSTDHYSVCCMNECEPIMADIEAAVGAPLAEVSEILSLVGNMTSMQSVEDEVDVHLDASLISQLDTIAAANGGKVPIHGRLFAQWLHYVFPRECAFPHRAGAAQSLSPDQYGEGYLASDEEMKAHAKDTSAEIPLATMPKEELHWMSQWSEDEELIASYDGLISRPVQSKASSTFIMIGFALFVLAGLAGVVSFNRKVPNQSFLLPSSNGKTHFV
eukprot:TRINITY_DN3431_c0_g1_i1.p1 TRINITY_DN3431_c0_g1~~TRINITY_DN3431_c0_g1_i1.p1  ORF type:complete len:575 (-),score=109.38 TRINITY_DN3431_c0_g1_i1:197-1921(-)